MNNQCRVTIDTNTHQAVQDECPVHDIREQALELGIQNCDNEDFQNHVFDSLPFEDKDAFFKLFESILQNGTKAKITKDLVLSFENITTEYFQKQSENA